MNHQVKSGYTSLLITLGELKERWESRGEHLTSIRSGSLIFVFGHDKEFKAIQMLAKHSEIKKAILLFLHKIGSQVEDISMKSVVQKAKRTAKGTAKRQRQQKESGQIITGMDGDSTAIHSNVSGTQNVQEMHQELGNMYFGGDVSVNIKYNFEGGTHETDWHINPAPNKQVPRESSRRFGRRIREYFRAPDKHMSQVPRESFHRLGRWISEFCLATLISVTRGSLIFSFAHSTSEDAIDMIVKHRKVKEVFLDFVQELDPSVEDIRIEVVLRELSVSEEQTTQITETRPRGTADPEHKDEEGASRSHPQQKDDDETSHPHIQETGDNSSSPSHSPQTKDENTCLPHPQKTEGDKTSLQQTDEYTSHLQPHQMYVKNKFKYQTTGIEKALSDPSQGHSKSKRDPRLSTTSHATPSEADRDLYWASWDWDLVEVKRLLSTPGVDVNCRVAWWSMTPVLAAAYKGHRDVVELLVSEGADVSLVDMVGDNILHYACMRGDLEMVKYVLSLNVVDIDARNMWGQTAADVARSEGHQPVLDLLVSRGAQ